MRFYFSSLALKHALGSLRLEGFISRNIRKYKKFFNLMARKFHFPKYKKTFSGECIRNFFRVDFFYFVSSGLKVRQVAPYYTTNIFSKFRDELADLAQILYTETW